MTLGLPLHKGFAEALNQDFCTVSLYFTKLGQMEFLVSLT